MPLTKRSADHSSMESFSFGFLCDCCGKEWTSQPVKFISGGFTAIDHEEVRQLIWLQEHKTAFDRANLEAHFYFNYSPGSKEWICDDCYEKDQCVHS